MYGYGLFETIKAYNGKPIFLDEHIIRLINGCKSLDLKLEIDSKRIKKICNEVIKANNINYGAIKIVYTANKGSYYFIVTTRKISYKKEDYLKGFRLCFSDIKRNPYSPLTYIKSNNYMTNIIARNKALKRGYNEVIFLNVMDELCEGSISNIFFVKEGIIHTPLIECGLLSGITRQKIIDIANNLNLKIEIGRYRKEDILSAEEIFITNSLMDIMPVSRVEDIEFSMDKNEISRLLIREYKNKLKEDANA
ncbi:hypothetical protein BET03_06205 [Thermohalobacter berrensis]|uniref:4-amino-4-deoxychorismate lyase n=2 Tax=Thermohalobacter berrensis TaxID=99594 RepID=A0A419SVA3_9FIRM|nr:hypothetical protein BET03_06205 [Thermohalobacter berrensis]